MIFPPRDLGARENGLTESLSPEHRRLDEQHLPKTQFEALDFERSALFLDVDGTLLDEAATPEGVVAPESLLANLGRLETALGGAMAIVTGRTLADLDLLFQHLRIRAAGVHGAQMRFDPAQRAPIEEFPVLPDRLWRALNVRLAEFPGTFAENKRFSFAVHFRARPDAAARLRSALEPLVAAESAFGLVLAEARLAYEIKSPGFDKGLAIAKFMSCPPFAGRTPIFIGNDATDDFGFAAVVDRGGLAYSVGERRPKALAMFPDPGTVRRWLEGLLGVAATSSKLEEPGACA